MRKPAASTHSCCAHRQSATSCPSNPLLLIAHHGQQLPQVFLHTPSTCHKLPIKPTLLNCPPRVTAPIPLPAHPINLPQAAHPSHSSSLPTKSSSPQTSTCTPHQPVSVHPLCAATHQPATSRPFILTPLRCPPKAAAPSHLDQGHSRAYYYLRQ